MDQRAKDNTAAVIDGILKFVAVGGFVTTALVLQNSAQMFDKPLDKMLKIMDKRQQERELRRIIYYMKQKGLVRYQAGDYEHGIQLTQNGKQRLKKANFVDLQIPKPSKWDGQWRLVFFDIPETSKKKRDYLTFKLKELGFKMLQQSIWVHPFSCRPEIEMVGEFLGVRRYISYVEINQIDSEHILRERFKNLIN